MGQVAFKDAFTFSFDPCAALCCSLALTIKVRPRPRTLAPSPPRVSGRRDDRAALAGWRRHGDRRVPRAHFLPEDRQCHLQGTVGAGARVACLLCDPARVVWEPSQICGGALLMRLTLGDDEDRYHVRCAVRRVARGRGEGG